MANPPPATKNNNTGSTLKVIQGVGFLLLGIALLSAATWIYLKNRDVFVLLVAGVMAIGSFMIMGAVVEQRDRIEALQYQMIFGISMAMGILSTAVLAIFIARVMQLKKEKQKYSEVPTLDSGNFANGRDPLEGLRI